MRQEHDRLMRDPRVSEEPAMDRIRKYFEDDKPAAHTGQTIPCA
jgi:hypothetical protein